MIHFRPFTEADVQPLTSIMKSAFDCDTKIHLGKNAGGPPGYDNGDFLRQFALHPESTSFVIEKENKPIGAIILWLSANTAFLGNLFLDESMQEQGIGFHIWTQIESMFPHIRLWKTETPGFSKRNHHFYVNKCRFQIVRIENCGQGLAECYHMEKSIAPPQLLDS